MRLMQLPLPSSLPNMHITTLGAPRLFVANRLDASIALRPAWTLTNPMTIEAESLMPWRAARENAYVVNDLWVEEVVMELRQSKPLK